jgi:ATP-binding cassette, subfamily B, multidrug efflux pump
VRELRALLPYLRPYRWGIIAGLALVVLSNALNMAVPFLIMRGVDALGTPDVTRTDLLTFALLAVGAALVGGAGRFGMRQLLNGISRRVELDLRNDFFAHLLRMDAGFYQRHPTGDLMSRATNDLQAVRMVAGPAYMYLVNTLVAGAIALGLMLWIDPALTAFALLPMLALPPVTVGFGRIIHRRFEKIQEQLGDVTTMVQENLAGVRIVRAYGQESSQVERFRAASGEYLRRNLDLVKVSGLFHPLLGMIAGLGMAVALLVGGRAVILGQITTGAFIAFLLYLGMLTWPLIALGWVVNLFQRGAASMRRINDVLRQEARIVSPVSPVEPGEIQGEMELRDISFRYPGTERWVLRHVSLRIPAGRTVAIVGPTASGKSTLVALLTRLYDPTEGEVLLDGVPLPQLALERLRGSIGAVPQDAFLFSESIADNLSLGIDHLPGEQRDARVHEASRAASLHDTVTALPAGYGTMLGERGINLSGGQKQRAALARAIARDPRVLVLDDALSAVDTHTEHEILHNLRDVRSGRTTVIVSHRVTAVLDADHIVVLDDGRVVEEGTHPDLMQAGGLYAQLQRRQVLAETLAEPGLLAGDGVQPLDFDAH